MTLLLVESDDDLRQFLTEMFETGHHNVKSYRQLQGIHKSEFDQANLFVLDWDHNPERVKQFILERALLSDRPPVILLCIDIPEDRGILRFCMDVYVKPNLSRLIRIAESS